MQIQGCCCHLHPPRKQAHHTSNLHPQPPKQFAKSLSGLIERVTFFNEENGFAVLKVKAKGHRDHVTVIGSLPSVSAGEWVTAEGRWVQDKEFGLQFRAKMLASTAPTTKEGIEKYLGSGMVKGIGPIYAKKLVDKFGEQIFDVIEKQSARLEELDGIGPKRRKRIKDAWAEQKVIRQIMVFLHSNGVSTSRAVRIYKTYGEDAIEKVQANPYTLAKDIRELNVRLQNELNPARDEEPMVEKFGWQFRPRDKVIQTENDYDKDVFNGDIGQIVKIDPVEREVVIRFDQREVVYDFGELDEISLAYAITIHKSQGSEFPAVVTPLATQQYLLLQRNLVYTGITRGKKLVVLIGQRKALAIAVRNNKTEHRFSGLLARLTTGQSPSVTG